MHVKRICSYRFASFCFFLRLIDRESASACCRNKSCTRSRRGDIFKNTFSPRSPLFLHAVEKADSRSRVTSQVVVPPKYFPRFARGGCRGSTVVPYVRRTFCRQPGWMRGKSGEEELSGRKSRSFRSGGRSVVRCISSSLGRRRFEEYRNGREIIRSAHGVYCSRASKNRALERAFFSLSLSRTSFAIRAKRSKCRLLHLDVLRPLGYPDERAKLFRTIFHFLFTYVRDTR